MLEEPLGRLPFVLYVFPVALASWAGGLRAGLFATVLSLITGWLLFVQPAYAILKGSASDSTRVVLFLGTGAAIAAFGELMQRYRATARRSEDHFRGTFENAAVGMAHVSLNGVWLRVNRRLCSILGRTEDELLSLACIDHVHPEDHATCWSCIAEVIDGKHDSHSMEQRYMRGDGTTVWVALTISVHRHEDLQPEHLIFVIQDVTQRRQAEADLGREREHLQLVLDAAEMGTWEWDIATGEVTWSHRLQSLSGIAQGEFGCTYEAGMGTVHPDDYQRVQEAVQRSLQTDAPYHAEYRTIQPEGAVRWIMGTGRLIRDEDGATRRLLGVAMDTTARKRAELALEQSEARFRTTFEMAAVGMAMSSIPTGRFIAVNQKLADITGHSREELSDRTFLDITHPEDREGNKALFDQLLEGAIPSFSCEKRYIRKDGAMVWVQTTTSLVRNTAGEPLHTIGIIADITERKAGEFALLNANRELEQFAFVASHDLQEPLRMVNAYTQLLLRRTPLGSDPEAQQYAEFVRRGVERMEALLRDLLTYARLGHSDGIQEHDGDLSEALSHAMERVHSSIQESDASIVSDPLPVVRGDTMQLARVLQNLLSNAMKYRKPDIPPDIRISAQQDGEYWVISVRDNGIGFDERYANRIFGLFKRLHNDSYPGTGLGLAICQRIVERLGGRIWAESKIGEGSVFHFRLPAAQARPQ